MSQLEEAIQKMVADQVEKALEEKLPAIIRALGVSEVESHHDDYGDALAVARLLGRDTSTPEKVLKARKHVYNLARKNLIPSIRISERNLKFDLAKVRQTLNQKAA
jgi:hypothetical protein